MRIPSFDRPRQRLGGALVVAGIIAAFTVSGAVDAQTAGVVVPTAEDHAALSARVVDLEQRVAALEGEQTTTTEAPATTTTTTEPTTTTTSAPPETTTTTVAPASWPGPDNTGPTGPLTVMAARTVRDGEVLENFDISGTVKFEGNAIIRNGIIRGGMYALSHTRSTVPGSALIEDVELAGAGGSAGIAPYGSWTLRRANVHGYRDGVKLGSGQTVEASWIHDLHKVDGSHNDAMQATGSRDVRLIGNNIEGPFRQSTSALILGTGSGTLSDYLIEGNRLSGGSYTLYIGGKDGQPTPSNIVVRDNVFVRDSWLYGPTSFRLGWPAGDPGAVWEGNTFDDGAPLNR